jgi:hypothetical protein
MSAIHENRLFLGNPGTGKSTLINCLLGDAQFKSGLSWGGGLTQDYQRFDKDGIAYMDAPGLADETIQLQAAQAITKALKQSGKYKLFFMVRLQNGRVVGEDLVTLERVLDSIDAGDLNYKFTIVINCLGERQYQALAARGDEYKTIKTLINRRYLTESFCFIPRIEALEEKSDAVVELPQKVREFLDNEAPTITVEEQHVKPIAVDGFDAQAQEIKSELEKLRQDQSALLQAMKDQEKRHDEAMKRMRATHAVELDRMDRGVTNKYPPVAALSPRGNHDYMALPLTPPAIPQSATGFAWVCRGKRAAALVVAVFLVITIIIIVVATTRSKAPESHTSPSSNSFSSTGSSSTISGSPQEPVLPFHSVCLLGLLTLILS